MYQRNATCLHCGASFDQEGRGRARVWCFDCLPHKATAPSTPYHRRSSQLNVFRKTGEHSACCPKPRRELPSPAPLPLCAECGATPISRRNALTCSAECSKLRSKRVVQEYRASERGRETYRKIKRRSDQYRKRKLRADRVDRFDDEEIFERDRWVCQLCGKRARRGAKAPHPMAPTIDHIIPLSRGGEHSKANVQCAHLQCNARKNVTACGSQLRLIG